MKLAAVTGSTGMIGRRVVEQLIQKGVRVRAMQHSAAVLVPDCEVIVGDLVSDDSLSAFLDDADVVFHCAAELHDDKSMHEVNVLATAHFARLASELGVKCFVHLSSAGVVGPASVAWIDEVFACHPLNAYEKSKWEAEESLARLCNKGMRICLLRPTNVIDDVRPGVLAMAFRYGWRDRSSLLIKGGESAHLVHAEDVAAAALFLAEHNTCSGAYFVGCDEDDNNTVAGVFNLARNYLGERGYCGSVLPVWVSHYLRTMMKGKCLHGRTRFSSVRLTGSGFEFPLGLDGAVKRICRHHRLKR